MFEKKEKSGDVKEVIVKGEAVGVEPVAETEEMKLVKKMRSVKGPIEVVAIRQGYYNHQLKNEGDKFTIKSGADFGTWMEEVDGDEEVDVPAEKNSKKTQKGKKIPAEHGPEYRDADGDDHADVGL